MGPEPLAGMARVPQGGTESDARGCLSQTPLCRDALNNLKKDVKELPDSARKVDKTQKLSAIKKSKQSVS